MAAPDTDQPTLAENGNQDRPKDEVQFYTKFADPLLLALPRGADRARAGAWIMKLQDEALGEERLRADYLKLLIFSLNKRQLIGIFADDPNDYTELEDFSENFSITEYAKCMSQAAEKQRLADISRQVAGDPDDMAPIMSDYSEDKKEYCASQDIPNFGVHTYYAFSHEPFTKWKYSNYALLSTPTGVRRREINEKICHCEPTDDPKECQMKEERGRGKHYGMVPPVHPMGEIDGPDTYVHPLWGSYIMDLKESATVKSGKKVCPMAFGSSQKADDLSKQFDDLQNRINCIKGGIGGSGSMEKIGKCKKKRFPSPSDAETHSPIRLSGGTNLTNEMVTTVNQNMCELQQQIDLLRRTLRATEQCISDTEKKEGKAGGEEGGRPPLPPTCVKTKQGCQQETYSDPETVVSNSQIPVVAKSRSDVNVRKQKQYGPEISRPDVAYEKYVRTMTEYNRAIPVYPSSYIPGVVPRYPSRNIQGYSEHVGRMQDAIFPPQPQKAPSTCGSVTFNADAMKRHVERVKSVRSQERMQRAPPTGGPVQFNEEAFMKHIDRIQESFKPCACSSTQLAPPTGGPVQYNEVATQRFLEQRQATPRGPPQRAPPTGGPVEFRDAAYAKHLERVQRGGPIGPPQRAPPTGGPVEFRDAAYAKHLERVQRGGPIGPPQRAPPTGGPVQFNQQAFSRHTNRIQQATDTVPCDKFRMPPPSGVPAVFNDDAYQRYLERMQQEPRGPQKTPPAGGPVNFNQPAFDRHVDRHEFARTQRRPQPFPTQEEGGTVTPCPKKFGKPYGAPRGEFEEVLTDLELSEEPLLLSDTLTISWPRQTVSSSDIARLVGGMAPSKGAIPKTRASSTGITRLRAQPANREPQVPCGAQVVSATPQAPAAKKKAPPKKKAKPPVNTGPPQTGLLQKLQDVYASEPYAQRQRGIVTDFPRTSPAPRFDDSDPQARPQIVPRSPPMFSADPRVREMGQKLRYHYTDFGHKGGERDFYLDAPTYLQENPPEECQCPDYEALEERRMRFDEDGKALDPWQGLAKFQAEKQKLREAQFVVDFDDEPKPKRKVPERFRKAMKKRSPEKGASPKKVKSPRRSPGLSGRPSVYESTFMADPATAVLERRNVAQASRLEEQRRVKQEEEEERRKKQEEEEAAKGGTCGTEASPCPAAQGGVDEATRRLHARNFVDAAKKAAKAEEAAAKAEEKVAKAAEVLEKIEGPAKVDDKQAATERKIAATLRATEVIEEAAVVDATAPEDHVNVDEETKRKQARKYIKAVQKAAAAQSAAAEAESEVVKAAEILEEVEGPRRDRSASPKVSAEVRKQAAAEAADNAITEAERIARKEAVTANEVLRIQQQAKAAAQEAAELARQTADDERVKAQSAVEEAKIAEQLAEDEEAAALEAAEKAIAAKKAAQAANRAAAKALAEKTRQAMKKKAEEKKGSVCPCEPTETAAPEPEQKPLVRRFGFVPKKIAPIERAPSPRLPSPQRVPSPTQVPGRPPGGIPRFGKIPSRTQIQAPQIKVEPASMRADSPSLTPCAQKLQVPQPLGAAIPSPSRERVPSPKPAISRPGIPRPGIPRPGIPRPAVPSPRVSPSRERTPSPKPSGIPGIPRPGIPRPGIPRPGIPRPGVPTAVPSPRVSPSRERTPSPKPAIPRPSGIPGIPRPGIPRPGIPRPGIPRPGAPTAVPSTRVSPPRVSPIRERTPSPKPSGVPGIPRPGIPRPGIPRPGIPRPGSKLVKPQASKFPSPIKIPSPVRPSSSSSLGLLGSSPCGGVTSTGSLSNLRTPPRPYGPSPRASPFRSPSPIRTPPRPYGPSPRASPFRSPSPAKTPPLPMTTPKRKKSYGIFDASPPNIIDLDTSYEPPRSPTQLAFDEYAKSCECLPSDDDVLPDSLPSWNLSDVLGSTGDGSAQAPFTRSWDRRSPSPRAPTLRRDSAPGRMPFRPDLVLPARVPQMSPSKQNMIQRQVERAQALRLQQETPSRRDFPAFDEIGFESPPSFDDFELTPPPKKTVCFKSPEPADRRSPTPPPPPPPKPKKAEKKKVPIQLSRSQLLQQAKLKEEKKKKEQEAKRASLMKLARRKRLEKETKAKPSTPKQVTPKPKPPSPKPPSPRPPSPKAPSPKAPSPRPPSPKAPSPRPPSPRTPRSPPPSPPTCGLSPSTPCFNLSAEDFALNDSDLPSFELDDYLDVSRGSPQGKQKLGRSWERPSPRPTSPGRRGSAPGGFEAWPEMMYQTPKMSPGQEAMYGRAMERARSAERLRAERAQPRDVDFPVYGDVRLESPPAFYTPPKKTVCFRSPTADEGQSPPAWMPSLNEQMAALEMPKAPKKPIPVKLTKSQMLQKKKMEEEKKKQEAAAAKKGARRKLVQSPKSPKVATPPREESPKARTPSPRAPSPRTPSPKALSPRTPSPRPSAFREPVLELSPLQGFEDLGVCPLIDDVGLDDSEVPSWELDDYLGVDSSFGGTPQAALRSWQRQSPRPGVGRRGSAPPLLPSRPDQLIATPPPGYKKTSPSAQRMLQTQLERAEKLRKQREEEREREERRRLQQSTLSGGERSLGMETPPSFEDFELTPPPRRRVCFRTPTSADKRSPPVYEHEVLQPKPSKVKKIPKKVKEVKLTKSQMLQKKKLEADAKKKEAEAKLVVSLKKQRFKRLEKKKEEEKPREPSPPRPVTPPRPQTPPRQPTPPPPSPELSPYSPRPFMSPETERITKMIEQRDKAVPKRSPRAVDTSPAPCPSTFAPVKIGPHQLDFLYVQEPMDLNVAGDLDVSWSPVKPASPPRQPSPLMVPPRRPGDFTTPPSADRRQPRLRGRAPGSAPGRIDTVASPGMLQWQRARTPPRMEDDLLGFKQYNFYPTVIDETPPSGLDRPIIPGRRIGGPVGSLLPTAQTTLHRSSFLDSEELSDLYASDSDASPCPKQTPLKTPLKRFLSPQRFGSNWLTPTKQPPRPFPRIPSGGIPTPPQRRVSSPRTPLSPPRLPSDRLVEVSPMDPRWQLDFEPPSVGGTPCSSAGTPPPKPPPVLTESQQKQLDLLDQLERQLQEMEDKAVQEQKAKEAAAEAARLEAERREAAKPKVKQTKAQMLREKQRKIEAEAEKKKVEQARLRELKKDEMAKRGRKRLEKSKKGLEAGPGTPCAAKERTPPPREVTPIKLQTPGRAPEPVGEWQQLAVQVAPQGYQADAGDVLVASPATQNAWADLSYTSDSDMPADLCSGSPIGMSSFEEELYEYERDAKRRGIVLTPSPPPKPPTPKQPTPPPKQPSPPKPSPKKKKKKYEVRKNRYQLLREKKIREEKEKAMIEWDEKERKICKKMARDYWKGVKKRDKMLKEAEEKAAEWDAHCEREAWRIAEENWAKEAKEKHEKEWEEVKKRIEAGMQSDMSPLSDDSGFEKRFQYSTEYDSWDSPPQEWEDPAPGPSGWEPPPKSPSPQKQPSPKAASPVASAQEVTPCEKREKPKRKRPKATKAQMLREKRFKEERAQKAKAAKAAAEADARRQAEEEAERARLALLPPAPPPKPRTPPRGKIGSPIRLGSRIDVGPHPMVGEPTFTQLLPDDSYDLEGGGFEFPEEVSPVACGLPDFSCPIEVSPKWRTPPLSPKSKAFHDVIKGHTYTPAKYDTDRTRMKSKTLFIGNKSVALRKAKEPTLKPVKEMAIMEGLMERLQTPKAPTPRPPTPMTPTPPPRRAPSPQFTKSMTPKTPSTPSLPSPRRSLNFDEFGDFSPPPYSGSDDSDDYLDFLMRGSPPRQQQGRALDFDTPINTAHQKFAKANQQVSALLGFTPPKPLTCGKQSDTSTALTMQSLSDFPDLDSGAICAIKRAWSDGDENKVLVEGSKMTLTRRDLLTLKEGNRPNENIINFYLSMIQSRSKKGMGPKCYAFNSYFYPRLESDGSSAVLKWTKKVDLFEKDYIFVPILDGCQWTLAVVDLKWKQLRYYDSHGQYNKKHLSNLLHYLYTEHRDKRGKCLETSQFDLQQGDCPLQENHADCGVFVLTIAEFISRDNRDMNFSSADIPYLRQRITAEIMQGELLTQYKRP